ncbi:MAG: hypothetical protein CVV41_02190 [Candidatus Riflebacteria bacterium HGW-Riflebacteria-1]|jgi:biotin carboxyl carrier protein|nr:MAG: hypothetical protein CVV41_02190 [Candidatus Riflebacteria bacterium HGW-Riflebacteria-1]
MQPKASFSLPEAIRNDISIYLAPDEKVLKAIRSSAGRTASKGEVWLVLSSGSVFFHTRETGKEPIIALLSRREIREIEYFQRVSEVVLTFVPSRNPQNVTKLSFLNAQRPELEDFCDDLADLINFKKETQAGVKTYSATATVEMPRPANGDGETPSSALRSTASAVKHFATPAAENKPKIAPVAPASPASPAAEPVKAQPEVKIVRSSSPEPMFPKTPPKAEEPIVSPVLPQVVKAVAKSGDKAADGGISVSYIITATLISVLVGFLWYKFFNALATMKSRK